MVSSPATFDTSVTENPAEDPHILLVMTKACYSGLTGSVQITWTGGSISFSAADFTAATTGKVPPSTPDADYTVTSLQDHLEVSHSEARASHNPHFCMVAELASMLNTETRSAKRMRAPDRRSKHASTSFLTSKFAFTTDAG